ncbi:hypothetical protein ACF09C_29230 [Streptomyces sp. NPDC014870]|uniref:hypothetical protein n=1 Tax=Streptomyces sp. NPDC014870 TaxID=3364925 RepID=UPI0036F5C55D
MEPRTFGKVPRLVSELVGRPRVGDPRRVTLYPGMRHLNENTLPDTKNRSWTLTTEIEVGEGVEQADGVIAAQGGKFGGWSLYLHGGAPEFAYSCLNKQHFSITGTERLAPGKPTVCYEFAYDGGGVGQGGTGEIFVDDKPVGSVRIERTVPFIYHATDWQVIGEDNGAPVTERYTTPNGTFTGGTIGKVVLEVGEAQGANPAAAAKAHASVQ